MLTHTQISAPALLTARQVISALCVSRQLLVELRPVRQQTPAHRPAVWASSVMQRICVNMVSTMIGYLVTHP